MINFLHLSGHTSVINISWLNMYTMCFVWLITLLLYARFPDVILVYKHCKLPFFNHACTHGPHLIVYFFVWLLSFAHHSGYFTGTGAIKRLPQCQWSSPEEYDQLLFTNPKSILNISKSQRSKTLPYKITGYSIYVIVLAWIITSEDPGTHMSRYYHGDDSWHTQNATLWVSHSTNLCRIRIIVSGLSIPVLNHSLVCYMLNYNYTLNYKLYRIYVCIFYNTLIVK